MPKVMTVTMVATKALVYKLVDKSLTEAEFFLVHSHERLLLQNSPEKIPSFPQTQKMPYGLLCCVLAVSGRVSVKLLET